jgi:hypothetical protein
MMWINWDTAGQGMKLLFGVQPLTYSKFGTMERPNN